MRRIIILCCLLVSITAKSDTVPDFIATADALKDCAVREIYKTGAHPVFNEEGVQFLIKQCSSALNKAVETCNSFHEKTSAECADISNKLLSDYYRHEVALRAQEEPKTQAIKPEPQKAIKTTAAPEPARQIKDIYWSQAAGMDGKQIVINYSNERSKSCPDDGFWYKAHLENKKHTNLCWRLAGSSGLTLLNIDTGHTAYIAMPHLAQGVRDEEFGKINAEYSQALQNQSNREIDVLRRKNPELFIK